MGVLATGLWRAEGLDGLFIVTFLGLAANPAPVDLAFVLLVDFGGIDFWTVDFCRLIWPAGFFAATLFLVAALLFTAFFFAAFLTGARLELFFLLEPDSEAGLLEADGTTRLDIILPCG
ncbi:MAG: hypothetical protein GY792_37975 [Gammaproteobacteria bacterium]|nr:hypothetical protein [Gammaproteobacteria bacterium]